MDAEPLSDRATDGQARRSLPMTALRLRTWVREAQPGARVAYGRCGVVASICSPELKAEVTALYEKGYLTPHLARDPETREVMQIVVRTNRPAPRGVTSL